MNPLLRNDNFLYTLRIVNRTRRDLVCVEEELRYGRWRTGGVEDAHPVSVAAGGEGVAMGIWAPAKSTDGYACRCVWSDADDENKRTGYVAITVSVPFLPGKNSGGLDVSGPFGVEGWTGIPRIGHEFSHVLTVREIV